MRSSPWLAFVLSVASTLCAVSHDASGADEAAIVEQLVSLGGQATPSGGAATKIVFRDSSKLGDAEFRQLGQLTRLRSLTLYNKCNGLTDETLPHLTDLTELEELQTDGIQVTDDGLKPLAKLKNLRSMAFFHISFGGPKFTGAGMAHLVELPKLERLTVAGSPFNDEGLAALGRLTQLKELRTWHTYQTPAGNEHLLKLANLTSLRLGQRLRRYDGGSNALTLTDETMATLAKMKSLETLHLDEARLTFTGLSQLKGLPHLKTLVLERIDIPTADVDKLRAELSNIKIDFKPLTDDLRKPLEAMLKQ